MTDTYFDRALFVPPELEIQFAEVKVDTQLAAIFPFPNILCFIE